MSKIEVSPETFKRETPTIAVSPVTRLILSTITEAISLFRAFLSKPISPSVSALEFPTTFSISSVARSRGLDGYDTIISTPGLEFTDLISGFEISIGVIILDFLNLIVESSWIVTGKH